MATLQLNGVPPFMGVTIERRALEQMGDAKVETVATVSLSEVRQDALPEALRLGVSEVIRATEDVATEEAGDPADLPPNGISTQENAP